MAPDKVVASDLPRGFTAWPNYLGANNRTWDCRKHWEGGWTCVNMKTDAVRKVQSLFDLPAPKRRRR